MCGEWWASLGCVVAPDYESLLVLQGRWVIREGRGRVTFCLLSSQVTLIPTFDSAVMHRWYEETHEQHQALGIRVLGSGSLVSMQEEVFPACKVEF